MTERGASEWARVEAVLDAVLDADATERDVVLDRLCGADTALRARVESLLRGAESAGSFLDAPAPVFAAGLIRELVGTANAEPDAAPPIDRVGPYRLIREVGRGGMGSVWLAERDDDEFRRQVAIKLMHPFAAPDLKTRFVAERQILASLDHPNIARLYDGGTTAEGVAYLVMEYIDGQRLNAYCDERRLTIDERLAVFETVCDAVQFAHQNMVVHRDLKPGNVLVAADGTVKLLDFGVAKLIDAAAADNVTQTGFRMLTPAYASPEQLRGEPVTVAADVYALGVLLHELLAGRGPWELAGRTPLEIERIVSDTEPARASTVAAGLRSAGSHDTDEAASARRTTPDALRRRLSGDLDNIVLAALRKEPDRRYPSVHHLRDDVRRHRTGLPIDARAPTFGYVAGKFIARHRAAVAVAVVLLLSLTAGLAGTMWQARRATQQAERAEAVRDFLVGLFESSDPDSTRGRIVTARELLDRGAGNLESSLTDDPALRADMLGVVGRIYGELGFYRTALPLVQEALELRRSDRSTTPHDLAESTGWLASVLYELGEYEEAERLAQEAADIRRRDASSAPGLYSAALSDLAAIVGTRGDRERADSLYNEAIAIDRRTGNQRILASHLSNRASSLSASGRYNEALQAEEEALALRRALFGNEHTEVAISLNSLGNALVEAGEFEHAEQVLREAVAIREKLLGPEHPDLSFALNNLGSLLQRMGRLEDAEAIQRRSLEIRRVAFGENHVQTGNALNHIGVIQYFRRKYTDAAATFEQVLGIWRAGYGPHHPSTLTAYNNLGATLREAGRTDEAERVLRELLAIRREIFEPGHPDIGSSLNNLALLLAAEGEDADAEASFREAIDIWRDAYGQDHPTLATGLSAFGRFLLARDRVEEAEPLLRDAMRIRAAVLDPEAAQLAVSRVDYAESLIALNRNAGADTLLTAALPVLRDAYGQDAEQVGRATRLLAQLNGR
jgi:serine/threonine-protein kinase